MKAPLPLPRWLLLLGLGWAAWLPAQTGPRPLANPVPPDPALTNTTFQRLDDHRFRVGDVILNQADRSLALPAVVNMNRGQVEYLLVGVQGKVHESVLRTEVEPYHVHVAMLLLGAKGAPPGALQEDYRKPVPGDPITVSLVWEEAGQSRTNRAEEWVWDRANQRAMARGPWTYSGSRVFDGTFLAQRDRSFIAIIGDLDALVNNPRPRRELDDNWTVNTNTCPRVETKVTVVLKLEPPPAQP